jgi:hypothetical protein
VRRICTPALLLAMTTLLEGPPARAEGESHPAIGPCMKSWSSGSA